MPAVWLVAALGACAPDEANPVFEQPDGGWQALADSGSADSGASGGGMFGGAPDATAVFGGTGNQADAGTGNQPDAGTRDAGRPGGFTAGGFTAGGFTAGGFTAGGFTAGGGTMGGGTPAGGTPLDPSVKKPDPSKLPKVNGACPDLSKDGTVSVAGSQVRIWVGTKPGPVYFYWHGTGSSPGEVDQGFPGASSGTKTNGGIVASWQTSSAKGTSTGGVWAVWYTGDFDAADQILACGIEKGIVDTGRIHTGGYSAGGLQTGAMLFMRSNYLASGIIYSGGKGVGAGRLQDPSNAPAVLGAHGAKGSDVLILDFSDGTQAVEKEIKAAGGFAMDCDDGASHVNLARLGVKGKGMQFLADHPYNTKPSPYAGGLPAGFPTICKLAP